MTTTCIDKPFPRLIHELAFLSLFYPARRIPLLVYTNADGQPKDSSSWSEIDFYLPTGQGLPTLDYDTNIMLANCQDLRGCYVRKGEGCKNSGINSREVRRPRKGH
jgi:hypothetical protein